jgi:hypothetical protein
VKKPSGKSDQPKPKKTEPEVVIAIHHRIRDAKHSESLGSDEEAIICLDCLGAAWPNHPAAATWLMDQLFPAMPVKRRTRKPS